MITRVYRGHHTAGLVAYLYGPGRQEEHSDQHLVACWDDNNGALEDPGFDASSMTEEEVRQHALAIARALDLPLPACENHDPQHVYHLVLAPESGARPLTDGEYAAMAKDMLASVGIAPHGDDLGCRWVAVRHGDGHLHVVATLARQDGRKPPVYRDFPKLRACAHRWEARLGLARSAGADRTAAGAPTIAETKKAERLAGAGASRRHAATAGATRWRQERAEVPKLRLARAVHAAAVRSHDLASFEAALAEAGVQVHLRYSQQRPEEVTGASFSIDGHVSAAGEPIRYSGSKLAPDLGWRHLQARWADAEAATQTAATAVGGLRDEDAVWQEAEAIVRDAAAYIRGEETDDTTGADAAAEDVAWAAADVAAGFAWYLEGARRGRHSDAAASMARAGRVPGARRPASSAAGRALRGMARTVSAGRSRRGDVAARRLVAAMCDLASAVTARRLAQARLAQAEAARAAADQYRLLHAAMAAPGRTATAWPQQSVPRADTARPGPGQWPGPVPGLEADDGPLGPRPPDGGRSPTR